MSGVAEEILLGAGHKLLCETELRARMPIPGWGRRSCCTARLPPSRLPPSFEATSFETSSFQAASFALRELIHFVAAYFVAASFAAASFDIVSSKHRRCRFHIWAG